MKGHECLADLLSNPCRDGGEDAIGSGGLFGGGKNVWAPLPICHGTMRLHHGFQD
jgi:hypothetical protein